MNEPDHPVATTALVVREPTLRWCNSALSEADIINSTCVCDAFHFTTSEADFLSYLEENHAHQHTLLFPTVFYYAGEKVIVESSSAIICVLARTNNFIWDSMLSLQQHPPRFFGGSLHKSFVTEANKFKLKKIVHLAQKTAKNFILSGHSSAGSIAHVCHLQLLESYLPLELRQLFNKLNSRSSMCSVAEFQNQLQQYDDQFGTAFRGSLPNIYSVGFGSTYIGSPHIGQVLNLLKRQHRFLTIVNERDVIPSILNIAQSAAVISKTVERFLTITRSTQVLTRLLFPVYSNAAPSAFYQKLIRSPYAQSSLSVIDRAFRTFQREILTAKTKAKQETLDHYFLCGTYVFLKLKSLEYHTSEDEQVIAQEFLQLPDQALVGQNLLQHNMTAYTKAVLKRTSKVMIDKKMDFYERLNIVPDASIRDIRNAYRTQALKWHPDKWSLRTEKERQEAEDAFKLLAEAFEVLSDPQLRKEYDIFLASSSSGESQDSGFMNDLFREGIVQGMTLDAAIARFAQVYEQVTTSVSQFRNYSTSSTSTTAVTQATNIANRGQTFFAGNHDNLFFANKMRVSRKVNMATNTMGTMEGTIVREETGGRIFSYVSADELQTGDLPAPIGNSTSGIKAMNVLGGAVAVGAGIALVAGAWSQYSDSSRRQRQAEAVRKMDPKFLLTLLKDQSFTATSTSTSSQHQLPSISSSPESPSPKYDDEHDVLRASQQIQITSEITDEENSAIVKYDNQQREIELLEDEFYECYEQLEELEVLTQFEDDYFQDCREISACIAIGPDYQTRAIVEEDTSPLIYPIGSCVNTPFGIGILLEYMHDFTTGVVQLKEGGHVVAYVSLQEISKGTNIALEMIKHELQEKKDVLIDRVLDKYHLKPKHIQKGSVWKVIGAGKEGALDSGVKAAGGMVLAKGMSRLINSSLARTSSAPIALASILVDIGKDYYTYRQELLERKENKMNSEANERILMAQFRQNIGHHVVSSSAAAAGAGIGAYGVSSVVGYYTAAASMGPVGIVAATGAAVMGGLLGYVSGSSIYKKATTSYFDQHYKAREDIQRLEMGAKILFSEYDAMNSGRISRSDCKILIQRLHAAAGSTVLQKNVDEVVAFLDDPNFTSPIEWSEFWTWVSMQALEHMERNNQNEQENREMKQLVDAIASQDFPVYPQVFAYLGFQVVEAENENEAREKVSVDAKEIETEKNTSVDEMQKNVVELAQLEALVSLGVLTEDDELHFLHQLEHDSLDQHQHIRNTIQKLVEGHADEKRQTGSMVIDDGFDLTGEVESEERKGDLPDEVGSNSVSSELDAFCSLLSTKSLLRLLHERNIPTENSYDHETLHALALAHAETLSHFKLR